MFDSSALCISLPALVKSSAAADGRRFIEVEASNEAVDAEGDIVLQAALLGSRDTFLKSGHIDIDHLSELGMDYGIPDPTAYIVGNPSEVIDLGNGRTSVKCELSTGGEADKVWEGLQQTPPIEWRSSIYGFPTSGGLIDTRITKCDEYPTAKRYVVTGITWKSLALTRTPVNTAIQNCARIVSAKSLVAMVKARGLSKGYGVLPWMQQPAAQDPVPYFMSPRNRLDLLGQYHGAMETGLSPFAGGDGKRSVFHFREHFQNCCVCSYDEADLFALALMQLLKRR